jgi:diguanylate cyclase (GGDEF)-like protein
MDASDVPEFAVSPREEERLRALGELDPLASGRNEQIERICALARDLFRAPVALVNLIDRDKQVTVAACGIELTEIPRRDAICSAAILHDAPLVVPDLSRDARFAGNPFVCGPPDIRFYAGAPLKLRPGINIGTLCVIDNEPRSFSQEEADHLSALAQIIVDEMRGRQAERHLVASQRRMAQTAKMAKIGGYEAGMPDGPLIWDEALYRIYGIPEGTPPDQEFIIRSYDPDMREISRRRIAALFDRGEPYDVELQGTRPNGESFWVRAMAEAEMADGKVARVFGAVQDITERKLAEQRIHELAYRDQLTGLPNRAAFVGRLDRAIDAAREAGGSVALVKFDIDHFREVNDAFGHQQGDDFLRHVADALWNTFGGDGTVARIGGDEFAAILRQPDAVAQADRLVQGFIDRNKDTLRDRAGMPALAMSAGLAIYPDHGENTDAILRNAKVAVLQAKARSRGTAVRFDPAMRQAIDDTKALYHRVWDGILNNEFTLYYQPIVSLRDGKVTALEALMRWNDPQRGVLGPAHFMAAFEEPDLAVALGDLALDLAIAQMRDWLDAGVAFGSVAVNLSTAQFRLGNLAANILGKLAAAGVPPQCLALEVTENVFIGWGTEVVAETVRALHKAGIGIALDDFGTGYASLSHLRQFPIDKLKIDKSFVQSPESGAIVDAVINMALSLGMQVVAEGVEKSEQLSLLRMKGCDQVQGYLFAKPMAADGVAGFIDDFGNDTVRALRQA